MSYPTPCKLCGTPLESHPTVSCDGDELETKWELLDRRNNNNHTVEEVTERMKVPNGWIYKNVCYQRVVGTFGVSMVFVPDDTQRR